MGEFQERQLWLRERSTSDVGGVCGDDVGLGEDAVESVVEKPPL